ncbi:MAG: hypothetical protein V1797_11090 [Pseudomonadota bacterium]
MSGRALEVPAPWALAILLGIQTDWAVSGPINAGEWIQLRQGRSAHNFTSVLAWIESEYWRGGRGRLMEDVPWTSTLPGAEVLGMVRVAACHGPTAQRNGYQLELADPRPAWLPQSPPTRGWADGAAFATTARPAAGSLFE